MNLLTIETKQRIKRAARSVGLLGLANRIEYAYGNRITAETMDFYRAFIPPGSLCFDIGAHHGAKTRLFRRLGARVVAVEPLKECGVTLQKLYGGDDRVTFVAAACGETESRALLYQCSLNPQNSTLSRNFADAWGYEGEWDENGEVAITTLDSLICAYGVPVYCKIDTEGHDADVLKGLSQRVPALSFEFHGWNLPVLETAMVRLSELGYRHFNYVLEPTYQFEEEKWIPARALLETIRKCEPELCGNVFVRSGAPC